MKQFFISILVMMSITLSAQQLKQIQKGTGRDQIPVTNGIQYTQVYRDAIPYILDSLGVMDSILSEVPACCLDSIFLDDSHLYYIYEGDTIDIGYVNTVSTKVKDTPTMKLRIVSDTIRADIKKRLNAGTVGGINTWVSIQYDSTGQITNVATALNDDLDKDPINELPVINFVFDELDLPSTPCKTGDWATDGIGTWWVCETDAPSWSLVSQAQLIEITFESLAGDSIYVYRVDVRGNTSTFALKVDNTLELSNLVGAPTTAVIKVDTSVISTINNVKNLISDSLATIVFPRDSTTVLGGTGITAWESPANTWNIQNDDPDQTVTLTPTGIISVSGAYPNFTIGATEVDGSTTNEIQTLSQSFTGTTEATYTLSNSGGSVKDTTGFMRLETMFSTPGSRTYRYKSNLGAIMGITEDPLLGGNSNIEVLRTGNQLTWGLRTDNASNGQFYKYNGSAWALATAPTGTVTSVGLGLGTTGTDVNVSGSPITGSGSFTLNLPSASASNRGLLSSANWTTFNNKLDPSTTFGPDVTGTYNNLRGKYMQWNADLGIDFNTFGSSKFTFRYGNAGVPSPGNVYSGLEVPLVGGSSNWQIASRITDNLLYFRNNNATTGTWQEIFSTLNIPNGLKFNTDLSSNFNTDPSNNTQAIRYAYANTNSPDGNAYDGFDVRRNNTYGWQMAKNGTSPLYVRGRTTSTWGSWEIVPTLSTGTAVTLYGLSSTNKLVPFTLGTGLSISGGTLNIPAPLSGTLNAIPYFNTTSTLSSMPITYSTVLPAMVFPTGNAIHLVGTATIIDKNNSYGSAGEVLSKASGGGVDWIPVEGTDLAFNTKVGTDVPLVSSTGPGTAPKFRDGTNILLTQVSGSVMSINSNVAFGQLHRASSQTVTITTSWQKYDFNDTPITNGVTASNTTDQITVPSTGTYEIYLHGSLFQTSVVSTSQTGFRIYNNTLATTLGQTVHTPDANKYFSVSLNKLVSLTAGDVLEMQYADPQLGGSASGSSVTNAIFYIKRIN